MTKKAATFIVCVFLSAITLLGSYELNKMPIAICELLVIWAIFVLRTRRRPK